MKVRPITKRHFSFMLGAALAGPFVIRPAAAQDDLLARIRAAKKIKVAVPDNPPYSGLAPNGTITGLAPTAVRSVLERLGVPEMEGIASNYGQLIPGLQAGRWDLICACMTITKERCAAVAFADPLVH